MLKKILESLLDNKEIKPLNPKGNQSWIFTGRTDVEAEVPILWPPDAKKWLTGKDPDAGKDWRREKGTTKEEMDGWHHRLNGHKFEQAPGIGMDREAWSATVHGITKSQTWLSYLTELSKAHKVQNLKQHDVTICCKWLCSRHINSGKNMLGSEYGFVL